MKKSSVRKYICFFILIAWFLNIFPIMVNVRFYKAFTQVYKFIKDPKGANEHFRVWSGYVDVVAALRRIKKEKLEGKYPPQKILFLNKSDFFYYLYGNYAIYPYALVYGEGVVGDGDQPALKYIDNTEDRKRFSLQIDLVDGEFVLIEKGQQ